MNGPRKRGRRYVHVMVGRREDGNFFIADHEYGNYCMISPHNMADIVFQYLDLCGVELDELNKFLKRHVMGRDYE